MRRLQLWLRLHHSGSPGTGPGMDGRISPVMLAHFIYLLDWPRPITMMPPISGHHCSCWTLNYSPALVQAAPRDSLSLVRARTARAACRTVTVSSATVSSWRPQPTHSCPGVPVGDSDRRTQTRCRTRILISPTDSALFAHRDPSARLLTMHHVGHRLWAAHVRHALAQ
jgi:hypothetical protein